jgi:hypothetical protein
MEIDMNVLTKDIATGSDIVIPVQYSLPKYELGDHVYIDKGSFTKPIFIYKISLTISQLSLKSPVITEILYESYSGITFKEQEIKSLIKKNDNK